MACASKLAVSQPCLGLVGTVDRSQQCRLSHCSLLVIILKRRNAAVAKTKNRAFPCLIYQASWRPQTAAYKKGTSFGSRIERETFDRRNTSISAAAVDQVAPDEDGWIRYRDDLSKDHPVWLLPAAVSLASLAGFMIKQPYLVHAVLPHLGKRVLGILGLDSILITNIRFLSDVLSGPDYGKVVLGYVCSVALAWHVAAGIESSRADSHRNVLLRSVSLLVFLSVAVGPALVIPLLWIAPYVSLNKEGPRKLTPAFVQNKYISADRVSAILTIVVASFIPYVGLFLTTGKGFVTCNVLALLLPATWQLLWLSSQLVAPAVEGHQRALNAHRAAAAASFAWHVAVVLLILKERSLPQRFAALWRDTPLYLTPVKGLAVDLVVVIAGFLTLPLVQEGTRAMLFLLVSSVLIGPGAAISLFFARREAWYLETAGEAAEDGPMQLASLGIESVPS